MKRSLPLLVVLAIVALLVPFAQVARANHGSRKLDVTPDLDSRPAGQTQTMVATLSTAATAGSGAINIDFELESGQNNKDGDSPATPDATCTVPAGSTSCQVSYVGESAGEDTWRVWVDHDGVDATVEADPLEDRNANEDMEEPPMPGAGDMCTAVQGQPTPQEPDCTDVVRYTFQGVIYPGMIDCDDEQGPDTERATDASGGGEASNENTRCQVFDERGNPITDADPNTDGRQATTMYGENESGPNDPDDGTTYDTPDYTCNTPTNSASNQCTMTVTQADVQLGTANICFWAVGENDASVGAAGQAHCGTSQETGDPEPTGENQQASGADAPNDLADATEVTWEQRVATGLDVETEKEEQTVGGDREMIATIYDQFGNPYQGNTTVNFEFFRDSPTDDTDANGDANSPATPDKSCTTDNGTTCTVTYSQKTKAGRDLVCAWIGAEPSLDGSSRNASGTCNDEKRVDSDDTADEADAPEPTADRIDVVETTWLNDPPATQLDCEPESTESVVRSKHTITCTAKTSEGEPVANTEVDVELTGANDPDNGDKPESPDRTCTTNNDGECSFTHGGGKATKSPGDTTYRAWIDADYDDSTTEADADEARDEGATAGATEEPDNTDVVEHKWLSGARTVSLNASDNKVNKGQKVRLFGDIDAEAPPCEKDQAVKLQSKRPGGKFSNVDDAKTDRNGNYSFGRVEVKRDTVFRTIAPRDGGCVRAKSNTETVKTK